MHTTHTIPLGVLAAAVALALAGCSSSGTTNAGATTTTTTTGNATPAAKIVVVGAENEYADVAAQIGGQYVDAQAIMSDPNTDPHDFEASASVAQTLNNAKLIIQNGVGYDDFMADLEKASPGDGRTVIVAQDVLGLPDDTPNPHLWYNPATMPAVAAEIAKDLSTIDPAHASDYQANLATFDAAVKTWTDALATFQQTYGGTKVAVTEPVADYMLQADADNSPAMTPSKLTDYTAQAAGVDIATPWSLQAAIMNDTDPSPQNSATQDALFTNKTVKVFLYNQQVTDDITNHYLDLAHSNDIPVIGVYETMPSGYTYQKWMQAELTALQNAIANGTSTEQL